MPGRRLAPQPLAPLRADFRLPPHSPERLDGLVRAALGVLERTGIRVLAPKALGLLSDCGAVVGRERRAARLAPDLVLGALSSAARAVSTATAVG